jgi:hypothetical protein
VAGELYNRFHPHRLRWLQPLFAHRLATVRTAAYRTLAAAIALSFGRRLIEDACDAIAMHDAAPEGDAEVDKPLLPVSQNALIQAIATLFREGETGAVRAAAATAVIAACELHLGIVRGDADSELFAGEPMPTATPLSPQPTPHHDSDSSSPLSDSSDLSPKPPHSTPLQTPRHATIAPHSDVAAAGGDLAALAHVRRADAAAALDRHRRRQVAAASLRALASRLLIRGCVCGA